MYSFKVQNQRGELLEITNNAAYNIQEIDGLDPAQAVINATRNAGQDGSTYNSAYVQERQITITMVINKPAEANRIALYRFFKPKFPVRIFYENGQRNVYIDGYVQTMMINFFAKKEAAQITIVCPAPYFRDANGILEDLSAVVPLFEFPMDIAADGVEFSRLDLDVEHVLTNSGDVSAGITITLHAVGGTVVNPIVYNVQTSERMKFTIEMDDGDTLTINTRRGEKSVTLEAGGTTTNAAGTLTPGSTWLQLEPGDNVLSATADTNPEYLQAAITYESLFEGV